MNTEQIKSNIKSYIPENIIQILIDYSLSILVAVFIFIVGVWLSKKIVKVLGKVLRKTEIIDETLVKFIENIVYYVLMIVVILAVLNNLGIKTSSFLAVLGAVGLAVGLALKDSLGNFASGVMIVFLKPFKLGDNVIAAGVSGIVAEVTIFHTVFLTSDNQKIIVPNSAITKSSIVNVNANDTRRIDIIISISYEDSIKQAKDILAEIINKNPKVLKDKPIKIEVSNLANASVDLSINVWVKTADYSNVKSQLLESIKTTFDEVGITIAPKTRCLRV